MTELELLQAILDQLEAQTVSVDALTAAVTAQTASIETQAETLAQYAAAQCALLLQIKQCACGEATEMTCGNIAASAQFIAPTDPDNNCGCG